MGRYSSNDHDLSAFQLAIHDAIDGLGQFVRGAIPGLVAPAGYMTYGTGHYQIFAASGTFIVPVGVTSVRARVIGAGGGGARRGAAAGPALGGGGGGFAMRECPVTPGQSIPVTVGNGGLGATTQGAVGYDGGTSSFGSFCSATGGTGGKATGAPATPGQGGQGIISDNGIAFPGGRGGNYNGVTTQSAMTGGGAAGTQIGPGGNGGDATISGATGGVATGGGAAGGNHGGNGANNNIGNVYTGGGGVGGNANDVIATGTYTDGFGGADTFGGQAALGADAAPINTTIILPRFVSDIICGGGGAGCHSGPSPSGTIGGGAGGFASSGSSGLKSILGGGGAAMDTIGSSSLIGGGGGGGFTGGGKGGDGLVIVEW